MGMQLLAAPLHVALDELLGVLLEDVVDLVEQLVDVFLYLLALLGDLGAGGSAVTAFGGLARPCFFLLLLCHLALHRGHATIGPSAQDWTVSPGRPSDVLAVILTFGKIRAARESTTAGTACSA